MSIFSGIETLSNHGTRQGILPRFYWQTSELAEILFGKNEAHKKMQEFMTNNILDFTNFYDLHEQIKKEYNDFLTGLMDGRYFSRNKVGEFTIDRSVELNLDKKIKDFFILGRLLINNFAKSKLIDSENFVLNDLLLVKDNNFLNKKSSYLKSDESKRFEILYNLVEAARSTFLTDFNNIRAKFEHENLQVPKFVIDTDKNFISEPSFQGTVSMIDEINQFYENMLDFIELLIVYSFIIQVKITKPNYGLFIRENYDYTQMVSKYYILPRIQMGGFELVY